MEHVKLYDGIQTRNNKAAMGAFSEKERTEVAKLLEESLDNVPMKVGGRSGPINLGPGSCITSPSSTTFPWYWARIWAFLNWTVICILLQEWDNIKRQASHQQARNQPLNILTVREAPKFKSCIISCLDMLRAHKFPEFDTVVDVQPFLDKGDSKLASFLQKTEVAAREVLSRYQARGTVTWVTA